MAISNCYVKLPEGNRKKCLDFWGYIRWFDPSILGFMVGFKAVPRSVNQIAT